MGPEQSSLPSYSAVLAEAKTPTRVSTPGWRLTRRSRALRFLCLASLVFILYAQWKYTLTKQSSFGHQFTVNGLSVERLQEDLATCAKLRTKPVHPSGLGRERNARYIDGKKPTLIKNATVWIGEAAEGTLPQDARAGKGYSWVKSDVFVEHGLIKRVERDIKLQGQHDDVLIYDARGRPLTSGIIDMHSHAGVHSLPTLHGNEDVSELSTDITPYVRSIDGIQPTDHQIQVIKSGGVTTSLVLPGSSNNIGGEAFVVKHAVGHADGRNETSVADMLADPDRTWRYMKMACGENAKHVHGKAGERGPYSRLGESWELRHAFEQASKLLREQDDWCDVAALGLDNVRTYLPVEIRWEALVAVLRSQAQVHTHCYTIPDLEAFVDHSNEFKFPIRAFHHAHQTYLVPEILKRAWGHDPPASALFADNMWYKAESYIGSEYAGKHLHDNGLVPIYVSDNPILNAQHLVLEAAKAYRYGLPYHAALASVTTAPAERLGLGQRLGKVKPGFDADIVVWDSDPLSVGATPMQVWIDGTAQFENPVELDKAFGGTIIPEGGIGDVAEEPVSIDGDVVFTGVLKVLLPIDIQESATGGKTLNATISRGNITCVGRCDAEIKATLNNDGHVIDLKNGYLTSDFTAFGSTLGLNAVDSERATDNGVDGDAFSRGVDGLALDTEKLHVSHRYGVTRAISAPKYSGGGTHHGTSVGFSTSASNARASGTVFDRDVALHYTFGQAVGRHSEGALSISAAVGKLRRKLLSAISLLSGQNDENEDQYSEMVFLKRVVAGEMALVVTVHSADTLSALLEVKEDVERTLATEIDSNSKLRLAVLGGAESHLLANELARCGVGVILAPLFSYAVSWDQRRALTGAPLTHGTAIDALTDAGVQTAIGLDQDWVVRDLGLLAGIAHKNSEGRIGEGDAINLISRNIYEILGIEQPDPRQHFVVHEGNPLEIGSRVKAIGDGAGTVHIF